MTDWKKSPYLGRMTDDEKEKEIVWRSISGLLRAIRHFEGKDGQQCARLPKRKDMGARFFIDMWSKPGFQNLIKGLQKKHYGVTVVKPAKEKPEEKEQKNDRAEFAK